MVENVTHQKGNNNKYWCQCEKPKEHAFKKDYIWNPAACT